jgi:acyl-CoA thioesterase-1
MLAAKKDNKLQQAILLFLLLLFLSGCTSGQYRRVKNLKTADGKTLVCFGNSLTAGNGAPPGSDYPLLLSERLWLPVVNAGVPGDTASAA